ncbi:molybdopterin-containing oxidoreductase family protein [Gordonibacter massiliensis (ex Traore et al. 2017)]|uniref:molybdopterin-containing oxidoreductase family protein n=1 Tax=Gordonibacter massiliensis (ex Traore et al. 2017) TaxID=1841863 RepID=UPI001C8C6B0F|nr:molybdopterin-dependent oxidoreductase [Gordonibacter massiliensis (ex Traore et al. 2017)]MBX9032587.1 molybdopterin-dependent oxidoreductase [Gordonibacter massiliensis (ex Traore et al. 2017)]
MSENENFVYTACQGWGCHDHCMLKTYVKDGVIERTERAVFPGPRPERNRTCQKGIISAKLPYIKERILHPMKRVGKRGENKFEAISWDQAAEEITAKLREIRAKYGDASVMINTFSCGVAGGQWSLPTVLANRLLYTSGATRFHFPIIDVSGQWTYNIEEGNPGNVLQSDTDSMINAKYIINWAGNPIGWTRGGHTTATMLDAQEAGAKIVHIGLVYDCTAAKADQFIPVKPASDGAMALAMDKIIVDEGLYDEEALLKYTVAPLFVRDDNGQYLRASDLSSVEGGERDFICWDKNIDAPAILGPVVDESGIVRGGTAAGNAYAVIGASSGKASENVEPLLEKVAVIDGIACKTVFVKLREHLAPWTLEKQEEITGVPGEVVDTLVHEYIAADPATICLQDAMRYSNGGQAYRAINLLNLLSGNFAKVGGRIILSALGDGEMVSFNEPAINWPNGIAGVNATQATWDEILDSPNHPEKQQYKAYINTFVNPVHAWPHPDVFCGQFVENLELMIALDFRETDTTAWADYILPECTPFEHEEIYANSDCIMLQKPAIERRGESQTASFVYELLSKGMGVHQYFEGMEDADWTRLRLASGDPKLEGITYERLLEEQVIPMNGATGKLDIYEKIPWTYDTETGRHQFYCEELADVGGAFGGYVPSRLVTDDDEYKEKYPLQMYPGRHRVFMQTQFTEFEELRAIGGDKPFVSMNPATAKERGIKPGDLIEIENKNGRMTSVAALSEAFPPGMAHVWYAYPKKDHRDNPPTVLSTPLSGPDSHTVVADKWESINLPRSLENGIPRALVYNGLDRAETYWEDRCEVRKIKEA